MKRLLKKLLAPMIREVVREEIERRITQEPTFCNIVEEPNKEAVHQDKTPRSSHHKAQQDIPNDLLQALQRSKHYVDGLLNDEQLLYQYIYRNLIHRNTHRAARFLYRVTPQIQMTLEFQRCDNKEAQSFSSKHPHCMDDVYNKF